MGERGRDPLRSGRNGLKADGMAVPLKVRLALTSGLPAVMRQVRRRWPLIVAYHGVCRDAEWRDWDTSDLVAESCFRQHLALYRRHYNVVSLKHMVDVLTGRRNDLPPRALAITFDDGYRNNFTVALPALRDFGFSATFFCCTGFLDGRIDLWWLPFKRAILAAQQAGRPAELPGLGSVDVSSRESSFAAYGRILTRVRAMRADQRAEVIRQLDQRGAEDLLRDVYAPMTWEEVRQAAAQGVEIGAHTVTHAAVHLESPERARAEVRGSADRVRQETGQAEIPFAYPNGQPEDTTPEVVEVIRQSGCYAGLANFAGRNSGPDQLYQLRRSSIGGHHTAGALELDLCGLRAAATRVRGLVSFGHRA